MEQIQTAKVMGNLIRQRKEIKGIQTGMEEVKLLTLFTDGMSLHTRNPEGATQKLLEINKQFQQGYKINIQKINCTNMNLQ